MDGTKCFLTRKRSAIMIGVVIIALLRIATSGTCSASVSNTNAIIRDQCSFSGYDTYTYAIKVGPLSKCIYYVYVLNSSSIYKSIVRKVFPDGTVAWITNSYPFESTVKSLAFDSLEKYIYFATWSNPVNVLRLLTSTGSFDSAYNFPFLSGSNHDVRTLLLNDDSGFFIIASKTATAKACVCKFLFSSPTSTQCQEIQTIAKYAFGQIKLSDTQLFFVGVESSPGYHFHYYKITFGTQIPNWANKMVCVSGTCTSERTDSYLSKDSSFIYSFTLFGSSQYLYLTMLNVIDGSVVGSRYKSSTTCNKIYGSTKWNDYIVANTQCSNYHIMLFNVVTYEFTFRRFTGSFLLQQDKESDNGRIIVSGMMSNYGYISRFYPQSIFVHPDFVTVTLTMNSITPSIDSISSESGVSISAATTTETVSPNTYTLTAISYIQISVAGASSDTYFQVFDQTYSIVESNTMQVTPDLSCSSSGSTSISYGIDNYNGTIAPAFVTIDGSSGQITISAPSVSVDTSFSFYIKQPSFLINLKLPRFSYQIKRGLVKSCDNGDYSKSTIALATGPVEKLINLTVLKCTAANCQKCAYNNSSYCDNCNTGFILSSGFCNAVTSTSTTQSSTSSSTTTQKSTSSSSNNSIQNKIDSAQVLSVVVNAITGATLIAVMLSSISNTSSMASLWSIINQMQILFLILITGAYIPSDVQTVITGSKFLLFPINYIPFNKIGLYNWIANKFDFDLTDELFASLQIKSDSSVYNLLSFAFSLIPVFIIHLLLFLLSRCLRKCSTEGNCLCFKSSMKWLLTKIYYFMTFGYYIRLILESNQYFLVSAIYESNMLKTTQNLKIVSLVIAILLLVLLFSMIVLVFYLAITPEQRVNKEHDKLGEFFRGIKPLKMSRLYICMMLIRRAIFIVLLILFVSKSTILVIGILCIIQLGYLNYVIHQRPYSKVRNNLIDIINEFYFICILSWLLHFNTKDFWSGSCISIYIWVVASNSMITFVIIIVDLIITVIKALKCKANKNKLITRENQTAPKIKHNRDTNNHIGIKSNLSKNAFSFNIENEKEEVKVEYSDNASNVMINKYKNWD